MKEHYVLHILTFLALLGLAVALYTLPLHYKAPEVDALIPCDISDTFSCSSVNQSAYSEILGVPVAVLGIFGFSLMAFFSSFRFKNHKPLLVITIVFGFLFELYLTLIEAFVLHAYCLFCVIIFGILILMAGISVKKFGKETIAFFKKIEFVD